MNRRDFLRLAGAFPALAAFPTLAALPDDAVVDAFIPKTITVGQKRYIVYVTAHSDQRGMAVVETTQGRPVVCIALLRPGCVSYLDTIHGWGMPELTPGERLRLRSRPEDPPCVAVIDLVEDDPWSPPPPIPDPPRRGFQGLSDIINSLSGTKCTQVLLLGGSA